MEAHKRSHRDVHEIHQNEHDEALNARRVTLVGGNMDIKVDASKVSEAVKQGLKDLKIELPKGKSEVQIVEIEKQVFVPQVETKLVNIPVPITEVKIVEIEKPIVTETIKTIEIEKPIITYKEKVPLAYWFMLGSSLIALLGMVYKYIL